MKHNCIRGRIYKHSAEVLNSKKRRPESMLDQVKSGKKKGKEQSGMKQLEPCRKRNQRTIPADSKAIRPQILFHSRMVGVTQTMSRSFQAAEDDTVASTPQPADNWSTSDCSSDAESSARGAVRRCCDMGFTSSQYFDSIPMLWSNLPTTKSSAVVLRGRVARGSSHSANRSAAYSIVPDTMDRQSLQVAAVYGMVRRVLARVPSLSSHGSPTDLQDSTKTGRK